MDTDINMKEYSSKPSTTIIENVAENKSKNKPA